jgi:branched-chain amino acid aminotransferase
MIYPSHSSFMSAMFFLVAFSIAAVQVMAASASAIPSGHAPPRRNVDWESFGFGLNARTEYMWLDRVSVDPGKEEESALAYSSKESQCLVPLRNLELSPTATVLNYGQALFEGLKASRRADGSIAIFRPQNNAQRMANGAARFLMPAVPEEVFVRAVDAVVRANAQWVPPHGKGALYLRPLLMGTGDGLGVKPSTETTFCIFASPVGNYFKGGLQAIRLQAVKGYSRAAVGGSGSIKASGNYAPAFLVQRQVRQQGFDEVLCLDAVRYVTQTLKRAYPSLDLMIPNILKWHRAFDSGEAVEEAGASNFFAIFPDKTIVTPSLNPGTILPGVTRQSILELAASECGLTPVERKLTLEELRSADEAFCCGTGACISPVGLISIADTTGNTEERTDIVFGDGSSAGPLTEKLFRMFTGIQTGSDPELTTKYRHWVHVVEPATTKVHTSS